MATVPAAALDISRGTDSGDTRPGPRSRSTSCCDSIGSMRPVSLSLARLVPADPGANPASDALRLVLQRTGLRQRLVGSRQGELREPVRPPRELRPERLDGVEPLARRLAAVDPDLARGPALEQGPRAGPERRHGAHPGDDDAARHQARLTTTSIASPTVLMSFTSSPFRAIPYSSSITCASSTRSSESTSSSSNVAPRVTA